MGERDFSPISELSIILRVGWPTNFRFCCLILGERWSRVQVSGSGHCPEASGLPSCHNPACWSADLIETPFTTFFAGRDKSSILYVRHVRRDCLTQRGVNGPSGWLTYKTNTLCLSFQFIIIPGAQESQSHKTGTSLYPLRDFTVVSGFFIYPAILKYSIFS